MDNILNVNEIESYCETFTNHIIDEKVGDKDSVTGNELLSLTPVKQVNLFIIKNLYAAWISESKKIKSPYFDYDAAEVKIAQKKFMNVLSKHIKIGIDDLRPLLKSASKEAVLLIFSPYGFYTHLVDERESLQLDTLKNISKYIKVNQQIFKSLIDLLEEKNIEVISKSTITSALNEVFDNTNASPDEVSPFFQAFSSVVPLKEEIIYGKINQDKPNDDEEANEDNEGEDLEEVNEETYLRDDEPEDPQNDEYDDETYEDDNVEEVDKQEIDEGENDQEEELTALNDKLSVEDKPTLADIHQMKKIHDIQKHLSINQRYMFIRALFDNDENHFRNTVNSLEQLDSSKEALQLLEDEFPHWDKESEEYAEFIEIVEKRLA